MANESAVLLTDDMVSRPLPTHDVVYMVADWTNQDADIAALLTKHGRNGIPLYLMYAADTRPAPLVLPQILTKDIVLEALASVSGKNSDVAAGFEGDGRSLRDFDALQSVTEECKHPTWSRASKTG